MPISMMRSVVLRKRKERDLGAERSKRAALRFIEIHPLAQMYRAVLYIDIARQRREWYQHGFWANAFCSAFANLDSELQAWLQVEGLLPGQLPDAVGERSTFAWLSYITALKSTKERWARLRDALYDRISAEWGEDAVPTVMEPTSNWDYTEPPF